MNLKTLRGERAKPCHSPSVCAVKTGPFQKQPPTQVGPREGLHSRSCAKSRRTRRPLLGVVPRTWGLFTEQEVLHLQPSSPIFRKGRVGLKNQFSKRLPIFGDSPHQAGVAGTCRRQEGGPGPAHGSGFCEAFKKRLYEAKCGPASQAIPCTAGPLTSSPLHPGPDW